MDIEELYGGLRRLQDRGETGNAYGGCGTVESEFDVLDDFYECILKKYEDFMPPWAEAFTQVYSWQFQTIHEGAKTYYENFYGGSDYETILRVSDYLRKNEYNELAKLYASAAIDCKGDKYPEDKAYLLPDIRSDNYIETVWNFYVDILEKHKKELL